VAGSHSRPVQFSHPLSHLGREGAAAGRAVGSFHKNEKREEKYASLKLDPDSLTKAQTD